MDEEKNKITIVNKVNLVENEKTDEYSRQKETLSAKKEQMQQRAQKARSNAKTGSLIGRAAKRITELFKKK